MSTTRTTGQGDSNTDAPGTSTRAFWRYWTSTSASQLGDAVTEVAMPLVAVLILHASAFEVSLVTAAGYAAWLLLGLPAGVLVARLPLRGTQVVLDLVRAAALVTVPIAAWFDALTLTQLVAVAFTTSTATVVFAVANMSYVPAVVPAEQIEARTSVLSATRAGTQLTGPSLAGILVQAFGAATALVVDVISFIVSAVALAGLPNPASTDPVESASGRPRMRDQVAEGWRYVVRHPVMGPCLVDATLVNFTFAGMLALTPVYLVHTLHATPAAIGLLLGAGGAASLVTSLFVPRLFRRFGSAHSAIGAGLVAVAAVVVIPAAPAAAGVVAFAVGYAVWQSTIAVRSVAYVSHRQLTAPPHLLPRVLATARFVSWGVMPFGALTTGAVASLASPRAALWVLAGVAAAGPVFLLSTGVRERRNLAD